MINLVFSLIVFWFFRYPLVIKNASKSLKLRNEKAGMPEVNVKGSIVTDILDSTSKYKKKSWTRVPPRTKTLELSLTRF